LIFRSIGMWREHCSTVRYYSIRLIQVSFFFFYLKNLSHFCVLLSGAFEWVHLRVVVVVSPSRRELFFYCYFTIGLPLDLDETLDTSYIFLDIKSELLMLYNIIVRGFLTLNLYTVYLDTVRICDRVLCKGTCSGADGALYTYIYDSLTKIIVI